MKKPLFIGEIKTKSPFGYESSYSFSELASIAILHADIISVHTNALWGGDFNSISFVRSLTDKPILAKGFHHTISDIESAIQHGADYVMTLNPKILDWFIRASYDELDSFEKPSIAIKPSQLLIELDYKQMISITQLYSKEFLDNFKFVYNGRNLSTGLGHKSLQTYHEYRKKFKWLCGASLIRHAVDVHWFYPDCDAFIVGAELPSFVSSLNEYKEWLNSGYPRPEHLTNSEKRGQI